MAPPAAANASALAKLSPGAKIGVGAGFAVLVAFTYWFIFYADASKSIDAATLQGKQLKTDLFAQQQAQATYLADREELANRQQRAREFNKVLPAEKQQPQFLSAVQQAAGAAGVNLEKYLPQDEQPQAFYVKDPMRLEVLGKFHQITKFMYEVGKLDRIINMENVELSDPKVTGEEVVLKGRCLATAFHTPKTAQSAAPGGAAK